MAINFLNTVAVDDSVLFVDTINDRVGIGTASPSRKLVVSGAADGIIQSNDTAGNGSHLRMLADVTAQNVINWDKDTDLRFATSDEDWANYSDKMRITSTGNVGIGTTSPNYKFVVSNGTQTGTFNPNSSGFMWLGSTSNHPLYFGVNDQTKMALLSTGNVGIGTTAPSAKLDVNGTGTFRGNLDIYKSNAKLTVTSTGGSEQASVDVQNGSLHARWILDSDDLLRVYNQTSSFDAFAIKSSGKVGIGTASPSEKLEVDGNIKIQSALLSNQNNTDVDTGTEAIASVVLATYTAAFFDFVIKKGTNVRSGTVYACHDGTNVEFTETSTNDLGDTSDVTLNVVISTIYLQLQATTTSDDWSVKSLIRAI